MYEITDKIWKISVDMEPSDSYPNYGKYYGEISYSHALTRSKTVVCQGWYNSIKEANRELMKAKEMFAIN